MTKKKQKKILAYVIMATMVLVATFGFYLSATANTEATLGSGEGGMLEFFVIDHATRPANYSINISEASSYVLNYGLDDFNLELPHGTTFDMVVKARFNATQAYDTAWNLSRVQCYMNATGAFTLSSVKMSNSSIIASNANYMWVNFYLDNSGSGYTLGIDETETINNIHLEYYG